jgi:hypothetical protein
MSETNISANLDAALWLTETELGKSLIMKGEQSYFEIKPTTGLFIDAERTKVESNVVPITGFTL